MHNMIVPMESTCSKLISTSPIHRVNFRMAMGKKVNHIFGIYLPYKEPMYVTMVTRYSLPIARLQPCQVGKGGIVWELPES